MGRYLAVFAAALGVVAGAASADDRPAVVVTDPSARTFRAAVQYFTDLGAERARAPVDSLRGHIVSGLGFSNLFEAIDPKAYLGGEATVALDGVPPPLCSDWSQIGADALLEGTVNVDGGKLGVEFRVWDVAPCRRLVQKRYRGRPDDLGLIGRRIADDVVEAFTGRPGAASTEIAFISDRTGRKEVHVMNADGGDVRAATHNRSINAFPSWLPDGDELVYTSYRHQGQPALFLLTRGSKSPGRLLRRLDSDGAPIYRGVFEPGGKRVAFVMSVDGATEIFTARRDGRRAKRLTNHRAIDISPAWSPDGGRMAFVSDRSGSPQVYVMDAKGRDVRRLTFQGSYNTAPAWSPDGRWIAYESRVGGQFDIWLIDPEGEVNVPLITHPRSDESPSWSPDGRMIAFSSTRRGRADIYLVGIAGGNLRRLTEKAGNNTSPAWGPHPR